VETCGDCRWYVQPPDLEWDWICFVLNAAGTGCGSVCVDGGRGQNLKSDKI
jgi:hypothetical protein